MGSKVTLCPGKFIKATPGGTLFPLKLKARMICKRSHTPKRIAEEAGGLETAETKGEECVWWEEKWASPKRQSDIAQFLTPPFQSVSGVCVLCKDPGMAGSLASRLPPGDKSRVKGTGCDTGQNKGSNGSLCAQAWGTVGMRLFSVCLFSQASQYFPHNLFPYFPVSGNVQGSLGQSPFINS